MMHPTSDLLKLKGWLRENDVEAVATFYENPGASYTGSCRGPKPPFIPSL